MGVRHFGLQEKMRLENLLKKFVTTTALILGITKRDLEEIGLIRSDGKIIGRYSHIMRQRTKILHQDTFIQQIFLPFDSQLNPFILSMSLISRHSCFSTQHFLLQFDIISINLLLLDDYHLFERVGLSRGPHLTSNKCECEKCQPWRHLCANQGVSSQGVVVLPNVP